MELREASGGKQASRGRRAVPLRRLLLLLVLFFVLTIPLSWLWIEWVLPRYLAFLLVILWALHDALGWGFTGKAAGGLSIRFLSHVPFLILVLLTPALSGRRRVLGALVGSVLITATHLFMLTLFSAALVAGRGAVAKLYPLLTLMEGLPLLIWVVVARDFLRSVVPGLREQPSPSQG